MTTPPPPPVTIPPHLEALRRHVLDLREGGHAGHRAREDREAVFRTTVELLDPVVRLVLDEVDDTLLGGTGTIATSGVTATEDGGLVATWRLRWPELDARDARSLVVAAHFDRAFLHPHLRGATVGEWPLNVHTEADAESQRDVLRAIVAGDLHNLVFEAGHEIIPVPVTDGGRA